MSYLKLAVRTFLRGLAAVAVGVFGWATWPASGFVVVMTAVMLGIAALAYWAWTP